MADPLEHVAPGDPLTISAATWNRVIDGTRQLANTPRTPRGAGAKESTQYPPASFVLVKNTSGSGLARRSILTPSGVVVDPDTAPIEAANGPAFLVSAPVADTDPVLILLDPVPNGGLAFAAASGVTVASVVVSDTSHTHAKPDPGNLFTLASATSGPVRLLQTFGSTGTYLTYVLLQGDMGEPGVTVEEVDGTPSYTGVTTLRFDQADGFVVSQPSAGVARVDMPDVVFGPSSATDNAVARYDGTTGKLIQDSTVTIADTGDVTIASGVLNTRTIASLVEGPSPWPTPGQVAIFGSTGYLIDDDKILASGGTLTCEQLSGFGGLTPLLNNFYLSPSVLTRVHPTATTWGPTGPTLTLNTNISTSSSAGNGFGALVLAHSVTNSGGSINAPGQVWLVASAMGTTGTSSGGAFAGLADGVFILAGSSYGILTPYSDPITGVLMGQTGALAVGATVTGGIITDLGTGTAATTDDIDDLASVYQPLDADLTALAALTGTDTIYYRSAADTWTAVTISTGLDFTAGTLTATGGVPDGDKGDVTVSSSGATWTIDDGVVTFAKMQAVSANVLLGNDDTGTAVEEIACTAAGRALLDDADAAAQRTTLEGTTVGQALFTLADPSAVRFIRINADNSVTARTAAEMLSDIGGSAGVSDGDKGDITVSSSGTVWTIDDGAVTASKLGALNGFTDADPAFADVLPGYDATATANRDFRVDYLLGLQPGEPGGRLTLTTGAPVTTSDVSSGTLYYTPYKNDRITLWDGTRWVTVEFAETSLALTATSDRVYDVFGYLSGGALAIESLIWTNNTTRATAVTIQDGRYCKSGDRTRLYLGTFYANPSNTITDSVSIRGLWNMYHRARKPVRVLDATDSWTYTTATWRRANNSSANLVRVVRGLDEDTVRLAVRVLVTNSGQAASPVGIGIDSATTNSAQLFGNLTPTTAGYSIAGCEYDGFPGVGMRELNWIEQSAASGTTTWFGDAGQPSLYASGMTGDVWC